MTEFASPHHALNDLPAPLAMVNADHLFIACNELFAQLFGYLAEELIGQRVELLLPKDFRQARAAQRDAAQPSGKTRDLVQGHNLTAIKKNGELCVVKVRLRPLVPSQSAGTEFAPTHWYLAVSDESATEVLEESNRVLTKDASAREKKLGQLKKQRERFLQVLCHELRTPLSAAQGLQALAEKTKAPEQLLELLKLASPINQKLLRSLQKIVDFSEFQTGDLALKLATRSIKHELSAVFRSARTRCEKRVEQLRLDFLEGETSQARAEWRLIRALLEEVLEETIEGRGATDVRASVSLQNQGGGYLSVRISDNGRRRGEVGEGSKRMNQFTGYELSRELIEVYSDILGCELKRSSSVTGKGLLKLLIPLDEIKSHMDDRGLANSLALAVGKTQQTFDSDPPDLLDTLCLQGRDILLVDDDRLVRKINALLLTKLGAAVTVAKDGQEASELLIQNAFDFVLTDLHMPKVDGFALARLIRQSADRADVPIFALTASATEKDRLTAMQAGINSLLTKPLVLDELMAGLVSVEAIP